MFYLAKYGVETTIRFAMVKRAVVDLAATADWTPATGDTKVSKDGGAVANTTNNPTAVTGTGSVSWSLVLTATELTAAEINVQIVDSATKAVEDQYLTIYTYGNAGAKIPLDLSINQTGDSFARIGATGGGLTSLASQASVDAVDNFVDTEIADIQARLPAALVSGRIDASVGAMAANVLTATAIADAAIDANTLATDMDGYTGKLSVIDDDTGSADRWVMIWYKNGIPLSAGITSPLIQVIKLADGTDLIASTAMAQVGSTPFFQKVESTNRIVDGAAYGAIASATIGGTTRTWPQIIGRPS